MTEQIKWTRLADNRPEDDELVLVCDQGGEVSVSWCENGVWMDIYQIPEGDICAPVYWAHMPAGPGREVA